MLRRQADPNATINERDEEDAARAAEAALVESTRTHQHESLVGGDPSDTSRCEPNDKYGTQHQQCRSKEVRRDQVFASLSVAQCHVIRGPNWDRCCGESRIARPKLIVQGLAMRHERSTTKPLSRLRGSMLATIAALAMLPAACSQPTILRTISCPVYVPPQTPMPEWPKECGGTR